MEAHGAGAAAPGIPVLDRLGVRARRRPQPRATIAMAGVGCVVAAIGAIVVGVSGGTGDDGGFSRWPGVATTLLLLVVGLLVQHQVPRGPLATAATIAVVASLPPLLVFVTFDPDSFPGAPWSTEAVLVLSTMGWSLAYLVGPGRGRAVYLGAAALGLWATVLQVTEKLFDLPFLLLQWFPFGLFWFGTGDSTGGFDEGYEDGFESGGFGGPELPSVVTIGVLSLLFGAGFLLLSRHLDRRGYPGAATPLLVAALVALVVGANFLGSDLGTAGGSFLYLGLGVALAAHGADAGRRATCWVGAVVAGTGVVNLATEAGDSATTVGIALLCLGAATVVVAHLVADASGEPDELVLAAPRTAPRRSITRTPPLTPDAGSEDG